MKVKHPKGIHGTAQTGYRAFVRVKGHPLKSKRFPKDADVAKIELWRERERAKLILKRPSEKPSADASGPFRANALLYLECVTAMPSYTDRVRHIFEWIALFGDQEADTITPAQIRAQRDRWLTIGPRSRQQGKTRIIEAKPLAASSVNHRLRALENLFTVLWPHSANPVRHVPEADPPETLPRALDATVVEKLFAVLPPGKTRARLQVLRAIGQPAKTLMRLKPADVDLELGVMYLPRRKKGKGKRGIALPLLPSAVEAFKALIEVKGWGEFSTSGMHSLVQRACAKHGLPKVTPYQLRHTFGTNFLAATKDLRATQRAMNHSTLDLTLRYAEAAVEPALAAAFAQMAEAEKR